MRIVNNLVKGFVDKGYLQEEKAPWLQYVLEKRITSFFSYIVIIVVGLIITDPISLLAFCISFSTLRSRTNGIHAKTIMGCILSSIIFEILFLKVIPSMWNIMFVTIAFGMSIISIWLLAPYNHPNMHLSDEEKKACSTSARIRVILLAISVYILQLINCKNGAAGIILGTVMAAVTMLMAYLSEILIRCITKIKC